MQVNDFPAIQKWPQEFANAHETIPTRRGTLQISDAETAHPQREVGFSRHEELHDNDHDLVVLKVKLHIRGYRLSHMDVACVCVRVCAYACVCVWCRIPAFLARSVCWLLSRRIKAIAITLNSGEISVAVKLSTQLGD